MAAGVNHYLWLAMAYWKYGLSQLGITFLWWLTALTVDGGLWQLTTMASGSMMLGEIIEVIVNDYVKMIVARILPWGFQ
jgi:hypothetical protein